jgi:hypothetical protein
VTANNTQTRTRTCDNPKPANGGAACTSTETNTTLSANSNGTVVETQTKPCDPDKCIVGKNIAYFITAAFKTTKVCLLLSFFSVGLYRSFPCQFSLIVFIDFSGFDFL